MSRGINSFHLSRSITTALAGPGPRRADLAGETNVILTNWVGAKVVYYHYTNMAGLHGIVTSGNVRLGSLAFMNDELEGYAVLGFVENLFEESSDEEADRKREALSEEAVRVYFRHQFAFCASTLEDDLSQWRAYTELGQGVCIAFDAEFISDDRVDHFSCIYKKSEKNAHVDVVLESRAAGEADYVQALMELLARFKHTSFASEQETRWVVRLNGQNNALPRTVKYRPHRFGLAPYIDVQVNLSHVVSVTLGPRVLRENKFSVEDFMSQNGCAGSVLESKCSLR